MDGVVRVIEDAFAAVPRPGDEELLHEDCADDNDIKSLYGIPHWRDVSDEVVEYEYAALFFLSPAGLRHFLPAYMSYSLRHPDSGHAVVGSTVFALTPMPNEPTRSFSLSKFTLFDDAQRAAVVAFLEAMSGHEDVAGALEHWRGSSP
jgi:hypothetical protein